MTAEEKLANIHVLVTEMVGEVKWELEDFCAYDYSGGNADDAWEGGMLDGERQLARAIKAIIEEK